MKQFKKVVLPVLCVVALLALCLAGCSTGEASKTVAVVAKGESHAFWQSVKAGAVAAGEKYGYKVTFQGPASESAKRSALSEGDGQHRAEQQPGGYGARHHRRGLCGQPVPGV